MTLAFQKETMYTKQLTLMNCWVMVTADWQVAMTDTRYCNCTKERKYIEFQLLDFSISFKYLGGNNDIYLCLASAASIFLLMRHTYFTSWKHSARNTEMKRKDLTYFLNIISNKSTVLRATFIFYAYYATPKNFLLPYFLLF